MLPSIFSREDFKKDLNKIHLVYDVNGKAVAFLRIDEEQEMDINTGAHWVVTDLKSVYFSKPHAGLGGISVLPEFGRTGIATNLLESTVNLLRKKDIKYLFSFVVISPITNFPSMIWHEKIGFERIAILNPDSLFGMDNYQSILYGKKL